MPPKKDPDVAAAENIKTLCILMASDAEFTPDLSLVAPMIGITQAKNVTRKVNSIIEPVGFTMKRGKIMQIDANTSTAVAPSDSNPSNAATFVQFESDEDNSGDGRKEFKTEDSSSRKRKHEGDDANDGEGDSRATKSIKLIMGDSDIERDNEGGGFDGHHQSEDDTDDVF